MPLDVAQRLRSVALDAGMDAIVCMSPENVTYGLGLVIPSQSLMRWRHAAFVLTAEGRSAAVCVDMELTTLQAQRPDLEVRAWAEFTGSAMATLAGLLEDLGLDGGRVGIERTYMSVAAHAELSELMSSTSFIGVDARIARARQIKSPEEIALLGRLSRIADRSIATAIGSVGPGSSEIDLAAALTRSVYEQGAEQFKLVIVATGERSELPNVGPTERALKPGDICRIEIFPVIDGYHAGVCRTAVVGEPPPVAERIYANLVECKNVILDAIEPGVPARAIYERFRAKFDELRMPPIAFVGHGIGVDLHEDPYLAPFSEATLEAGMVLGVEPLVYRTGHGFGMQLKDMIAVEDGGCRLLSDATDTDVLLRVGA
ncbi:MAG: M24 family metallopeptidase [Acidimicrobiales bacterium]